MATTVPMKGSIGRFSIDKVLEFMEVVGDGATTIVIKTDQEPSIKCLVEVLVAAREDGRTVVEESPVKSSGSNGIVERSVQTIEGKMRSILLASEERIGEEISPTEPVAQFIPEFAAYVTNRMEVGKDGMTAIERIKRKRSNVPGLEFGKKVLWKIPMKKKLAKMKQRWAYGIFLGVKSGEIWTASENGEVRKVRAVRRIPFEERWGGDSRRWVKHVPWNRYKGDEYQDGEMLGKKGERRGRPED
jgi:hypothetical protein